ncbi:hypothetical protein F66182_4827 [Fusarium sp. NRRL 66182]|nr:hypothetical protein F66182_4827 [Fusarium sp. NRRL 66182]
MGCLFSRPRKEGYVQLSDASSTYSVNSVDSMIPQVDFNDREEPEHWEQPVLSPSQETLSSPRAAFAQHLWARWHEAECPDLANCNHSFEGEYLEYIDSPKYGPEPQSATSDSYYTLWGSQRPSPDRTSATRKAFAFGRDDDSLRSESSSLANLPNARLEATKLRRTWTGSGQRNAAPRTRSPPYSA